MVNYFMMLYDRKLYNGSNIDPQLQGKQAKGYTSATTVVRLQSRPHVGCTSLFEFNANPLLQVNPTRDRSLLKTNCARFRKRAVDSGYVVALNHLFDPV